MTEDRFGRQRRLAEVGDEGQERIERLVVEIGASRGAMSELVYLERAGVGACVLRSTPDGAPFAHADAFRYAAARDLGEGAWRALGVLRDGIGLGGS